jgi:hypothetical protein
MEASTIAERLLSGGMPPHPTSETAVAGAEQVFADLFQRLSRWIGAAGCQALFNRALVVTSARHAVFQGVRYRPQGEAPHLDRLAANARVCGVEATADGITTVLVSIITILSGLIGDEVIAMSLLEGQPSGPYDRASGPAPTHPESDS